MSAFDPNKFLSQTVTGANTTRVIPVPIGEYPAIIDKVDIRPWQSKKDPGMAGLALDVLWWVQSPEVQTLLGRDKVIVKQGIMLDLTEDGEALDMSEGRNIGLGRLREAVGLNDPDKPFSFDQLPGNMATVLVNHRVDGEEIYAEVKRVARSD